MSGSRDSSCPFCQIAQERILAENSSAVAIADGFPVTRGHTLIIPRRHTADFFDLSAREVEALIELVYRMREQLLADGAVRGFNIGVNVGNVAGQTVMHTHVHLIPRYTGDVVDPAGGVRNVIPGKGRYM